MKLAVDFDWTHVGSIELDALGKIRFPKLPAKPGLYRFSFLGSEGVSDVAYFGESDILSRRAQHYRTPGPSQRTNIRLNALMIKHLGEGGKIDVTIVTEVRLEMGNREVQADLALKEVRRLAENAALISASLEGLRVQNL